MCSLCIFKQYEKKNSDTPSSKVKIYFEQVDAQGFDPFLPIENLLRTVVQQAHHPALGPELAPNGTERSGLLLLPSNGKNPVDDET